MNTKMLCGLAIVSLTATMAAAQQSPAPPHANTPAAVNAAATSQKTHGQWRASKLIGVDVYNEQNEKLGDIDELIVDRSGKISGVIIGVGGFLGMGQRDIFVAMDKLKFVEEPLRSAARSEANRPSTTGANTSANNAAAERDRPGATRRDRNDWYPDHAIMSGATKDSVRSMSEFKYD